MADVRTPTSLHDQASRTTPASTQTLSSVAVLDALRMILLSAPLNEVLAAVCRLIEAHSEGMLCSIFLLDEDGLHLRYAVAANVSEAYRAATDGVCIGPNVGSCGAAAYLRQPVFIADMLSHPNWERFRNTVLQSGLRAAWSTPILSHDGKVLGTFCMYYREVRHPGPSEIQLLDYAGRIAGIAIEHERSQLALTMAFEKIKKSEAQLREILDAIAQLIVVLHPDGTLRYANQAVLDYTGLSFEDAMAPNFRARLLHPEDVARLQVERRDALSRGLPFENEQRALGKDGKYRWFLTRYNPLHDEDGNILRWYVTGTDIEDRKQTEVELRQTLDAATQYLSVLRADGSHLYINRCSLDFLGISLEEWQKLDIRELVHPDDAERVAREKLQALSNGSQLEIEMRLRRHDGEYRWLLLHYKPLKDQLGRITRWVVPAIDIDDRKKAEERTRNENLALREQIDRDSMFEDIVGSSEALGKVLHQVAKVAPSDSTVLILGETGTGKELTARAIHKRSKRAQQAFIGVNCAAIPPSLIASELFGYEKGAFTGATQRRLGRFESANGGTIFLDEIGDLPAEIQIALLRVLQEREIERVGSNKPIPVDVRVLGATHRDLIALVAEGKFRQDLLYRLNVVPIEMPSLRERAADIPLLVEYFINRFGKKTGKKFRAIDKKTLKLFQAYGWPGNIRELQNVIERAVILSDGDIFSVDDTWLKQQPPPHVAYPTVPLGGALLSQEKEMIEAALAESHGRVSGPAGAATKLALPAQTLDAKIKRLGINKFRFKVPRAG